MTYDALTLDRHDPTWHRHTAGAPAKTKRLRRRGARRAARMTLADWMIYE